jgi:CxxC-x17-CxxC domain-containing protein
MGYGNFRGSSSGGFGGGRSSGGFGGNRGGGFRGPRRSFGPREMTKIKCSSCGKDDEVPFKPREGSPVYCKDCYFKQKGIEPRSAPKKEGTDEFAENAPTEDAASETEEQF